MLSKSHLFSFQGLVRDLQVTPCNIEEPPFAKTVFKLVNVLADSDATRVRSLTSDAVYELHQSYRQIEASEAEGGVAGFKSATDAVLKEAAYVARSTLPLAIAVVRGWNLNPRTIPRKHGVKVSYDYFTIVDLRPVPPEELAMVQQEAALRVSQAAPPLLTSAEGQSSPKPQPRRVARGGGPSVTGLERLVSQSQAAASDVVQLERRLQAGIQKAAALRVAASSVTALPTSRKKMAVVAYGPPTAAATTYTLVEVTPRGLVRSLYSEDAVYDMQTTYRQVGLSYKDGALHGFVTVAAAIENEQRPLLQRKRLPLAVAELRSWNLGHQGALALHLPSERLCLDFMRIEKLLEVPSGVAIVMAGANLWRHTV